MSWKLWKEGVDGSFTTPDPLFMYEKGGSPPPPQPPPDRSVELEQVRLQAAREAEEREQARLAAEKEERQRLYESNLATTYNSARDYGTGQFNSMGLPQDYGILSAYQRMLDTAKGSVPYGDPNVGQYINPSSLWTNALDQQRNYYRNTYRRGAEDLYGYGFEQRAFGDEADDPILESILGTQKTEAQEAIDRAKARGQLNDYAYGYANTSLGNQTAAARTRLEDMGLGVLSRYRTALGNRGTAFNNRINNWDFGTNIDLGAERSAFDDEVERYRNRMEGDVRGAIGDTQLFDIDLLLGKAMNKAGSQNTGVNPLVAAFTTAGTNPTEQERLRTLGNTGVF